MLGSVPTSAASTAKSTASAALAEFEGNLRPAPRAGFFSLWFLGVTDLTVLSNDFLLRSYEDIRTHVSADARHGGAYRLMGQAAKNHADLLLTEIRRRGPQRDADLLAGLSGGR